MATSPRTAIGVERHDGITLAASAGAYVLRGAIVPDIAGPVVLGSVIGTLDAARLLVILLVPILRAVFVVVLLELALAMGLSAFGVRGGVGA